MAKYSNNFQKTTNPIDIINNTKYNVAESLRKRLLKIPCYFFGLIT